MTDNRYDIAAAAHKRLRPQVKRNMTQRKYERVIQLCTEALDTFADNAYVDDWYFYERYRQDAEMARARAAIR